MSFKSGFVAILGRPNAGKSTLINTILKTKISIVSPKPQTTRNNIVGVYNDEDSQIVFTDTPGINRANNMLDNYMQKNARAARRGVDVVLLCIDSTKAITNSELDFIKSFEGTDNLILVPTKTDLTNYEKLYPKLAKLNDLKFIKSVIPVSAFKNKNIDVLITEIKTCLTDTVKYYGDDELTNINQSFMIGEIIREKGLWLLQEEIPHGIAVEVIECNKTPKGMEIIADIVCEKNTHKIIIIGKGGDKIKEIGTRARLDIEKLLDEKVFLKLFVKVKDDWRKKENIVRQLGYNWQDN